jgi:peptidoglycan-N-acetylglucosamine deacetylase
MRKLLKAKTAVFLCLVFLIAFSGCRQAAIPKPAPIVIPPEARLVCIFFDDGFKNQYDTALPVLLQYDFKATFGIITGSIGKGNGLMTYMNEKELDDLARNGMDIASHTQTHAHLSGTLGDKQLRREIIDSKQKLEQMGLEVTTFVYPYYEWDNQVLGYALEAGYTCARAGWSQEGVYNLDTDDPEARYHISAWQITNQNMDNFKLIVDKAGPNSVVCLVYHFIADNGPQTTSTRVANFQAQMSYLKNTGYTVIPIPDLFRQ